MSTHVSPRLPSNRDEYEISDVVGLLIQSVRSIDAIGLGSWRIDMEYPEDREEAERHLTREPETEILSVINEAIRSDD